MSFCRCFSASRRSRSACFSARLSSTRLFPAFLSGSSPRLLPASTLTPAAHAAPTKQQTRRTRRIREKKRLAEKGKRNALPRADAGKPGPPPIAQMASDPFSPPCACPPPCAAARPAGAASFGRPSLRGALRFDRELTQRRGQHLCITRHRLLLKPQGPGVLRGIAHLQGRRMQRLRAG